MPNPDRASGALEGPGMLVEWMTEVGTRKSNQDMVGAAVCSEGIWKVSMSGRDDIAIESEQGGEISIAVLADGVGGVPRGDEASSAAVDSVLNTIVKAVISEDDAEDLLRFAVLTANMAVRALSGPFTTLVIAAVLDGRAFICHSGDSRCYALAEKSVWRTRDHSTVEQQDGWDFEGGGGGPLTSCLGQLDCGAEVVDIGCRWKTLLLTSDGYHGVFETFTVASNIDDPLEAMVADAGARGSNDNISVVRIRRQ